MKNYVFPAMVALLMPLSGLTGCTSTHPLSADELKARGQEHVATLKANRLPEGQPLTLPMAVAYAVEHNATFRLQALDAAIARGNRHITSAGMLPDVTASAGYRNRNNEQASFSSNAKTGNVSLESSVSSDSEANSRRLETSWNVLDFGIAWMSARGYGDKERIAQEERRRVAHQAAIDIAYAWDKAHAFQQVRPALLEARANVEEALKQSSALGEQRVRDPMLELEYRSGLLLILKRINELSQQMDQARDELAESLGLPAGTELQLDGGAEPAMFRLPAASLEEWQDVALFARPEMRQAMYETRGTRRDARRVVMQALPSLALSYGVNYDSNSFLANSHWRDTSVGLSFDLIRLSTLPWRYRLGKRQTEVSELREQLLAAAILSQVAISGKAQSVASEAACVSDSLSRLNADKMRFLQARMAAASVDRLTMLRENIDSVLVSLEAAMDQAGKRHADYMLASAIGVGAIPDDLGGDSLTQRTQTIAEWMHGGMQTEAARLLREVNDEPPPSAPPAAAVGGSAAAGAGDGTPEPTTGPVQSGAASVAGQAQESTECRW